MSYVSRSFASFFFGAALVVASASATSGVALAAAAKAEPGKMTATLKALEVALKAGDKDKVVALFADDATIEDPVGSPLKVGKAAIDTFYGNAVARKIWIELLSFEELPDRTTNVEAAVHVGERIVHSREIYTFKPDGKIATMKAFPPAKKD